MPETNQINTGQSHKQHFSHLPTPNSTAYARCGHIPSGQKSRFAVFWWYLRASCGFLRPFCGLVLEPKNSNLIVMDQNFAQNPRIDFLYVKHGTPKSLRECDHTNWTAGMWRSHTWKAWTLESKRSHLFIKVGKSVMPTVRDTGSTTQVNIALKKSSILPHVITFHFGKDVYIRPPRFYMFLVSHCGPDPVPLQSFNEVQAKLVGVDP